MGEGGQGGPPSFFARRPGDGFALVKPAARSYPTLRFPIRQQAL